jgi:hypothetical protein
MFQPIRIGHLARKVPKFLQDRTRGAFEHHPDLVNVRQSGKLRSAIRRQAENPLPHRNQEIARLEFDELPLEQFATRAGGLCESMAKFTGRSLHARAA